MEDLLKIKVMCAKHEIRSGIMDELWKGYDKIKDTEKDDFRRGYLEAIENILNMKEN